MKKTLILLLLVVMLSGSLTGCKAKKTPQPLQAQLPTPTPLYDQWDYQTISLQCEADQQTGSLVCYKIRENDLTMLDSYLESMGNQGWELIQVIETGNGERGAHQTLIFKRERVRPPVEATPEP